MLRNNLTALLFSLGLHVGVAVVVVTGLPALKKEPPQPSPPIMIEYIEVAKETATVSKSEEKIPEAAPDNASRYAKAEAYTPPPTDAVPTLNAAKAKAKIKPRAKPAPSKKEQILSKVKMRSRPKPPSRFQTKKLAALIDRSIKEETLETGKDEPDVKEKPKAKAKDSLLGGLRSSIATASLIEAFRQQVHACWNLPAGGKGIENMRVTVRVWLRPDGMLLRPPQYIDAGDLNAEGRGTYRSFAESAKRAVKACEPYKGLPADRYDEWKEIEFYFDPSEMY